VQTLRGIRIGKTLRQEVGIPIHFHTHDTTASTRLGAESAEAGVDVADGAIAP